MTASQPDPAQRADVQADIAATRAELGETLEALAEKTQVKARAEDAAKNAVGEVKHQVALIPSRTLAGFNGLIQKVRSRTTPTQRRLSVVAVLAGALTALLATLKPGSKGGRR